MNRVISGLTAIAAVMTAPAALAGPQDADLWVGLENSADGFLVNSGNGEAWMTGDCLKPIAPMQKTGTIWTSHTAEMVSVGPMSAMLDQTFTIDADPLTPRIVVLTAHRGGQQAFSAVMTTDCQADDACRSLAATPAC